MKGVDISATKQKKNNKNTYIHTDTNVCLFITIFNIFEKFN